MGYGFCIRVRGERALFTRPECKAERVSYSAITPSAARGVVEAIFWHPGMQYVIDKITVLAPIRFDSIRRNELGSMASPRNINRAGTQGIPYHIDITEDRQQRAAVVLRDVDYLIDGHFIILPDKIGKAEGEKEFYNILLRRLRKGQHFHAPFLGCREFPARVSLVEGDRPESFYKDLPEMDMGYMLYDIHYEDTGCRPEFFHAVMRNGVIVPQREDLE